MRLATKIFMVLYRNSLKRTLPSRGGRSVSLADQHAPLIVYVSSADSVRKSLPSYIIIASVSRSDGYTSDATARAQQRSATAAATAG